MKTMFIATTFYRLLKSRQIGTKRIAPGPGKKLAKVSTGPQIIINYY
jgi:hypothetical protein